MNARDIKAYTARMIALLRSLHDFATFFPMAHMSKDIINNPSAIKVYLNSSSIDMDAPTQHPTKTFVRGPSRER